MNIDPATIQIWWVLGALGFLNLVHILVSIWDRTRTKPGFIERINCLERETAKALEQKMDKSALRDALAPFAARMDGMHASIKQTNATNEALFRDIMRSIGSLESVFQQARQK